MLTFVGLPQGVMHDTSTGDRIRESDLVRPYRKKLTASRSAIAETNAQAIRMTPSRLGGR